MTTFPTLCPASMYLWASAVCSSGYKAELSGLVDREMIKGKAAYHIDFEDRSALFNCLILCRFFRDIILWPEIAAVIEATTGQKHSQSELEILANAVTQKTREFNRREGISGADDTLPPRLLNEKTAEGASITKAALDLMICEYNEIREKRR